MILNKQGAIFHYGGATFTIGENVIANEASEYCGLVGVIAEIRDGSDKETENDTPDIYCQFNPPCLPADIKALEENFSSLFQSPRTLEDITLDMVILSPEMLCQPNAKRPVPPAKLYYVFCEWADDGEADRCVSGPYTEFLEAKYHFERDLQVELSESASLSRWKEDNSFIEEFGENHYEAYLDGRYFESHYTIAIEEHLMTPSFQFDMQRARIYETECRMEDFIEQISQWEEVETLTSEQYDSMVADFTIAEQIDSALSKNDTYWESYWDTVSEIAHQEVRKYLAESNPMKKE